MAETKLVRVTDENQPRLSRKEKSVVKDSFRGLLMFFPNLLKLCGRLLTDARVSTADKALFAGAIVYAIMPLDFLPDVIPFIGQVDDSYLIALTLLRLVNRTDETVIREHWDGGGDVVGLADKIAGLAPVLLPKRVTRVLSSRVELADAGKALRSVTKKREPLVIEHPENEIAGK